MKFADVRVPDSLNAYDISGEAWREYDLVGRPGNYLIIGPIALLIRPGGSTHRIVDDQGVVHCMPFGGNSGTVVKWLNRDVEIPARF